MSLDNDKMNRIINSDNSNDEDIENLLDNIINEEYLMEKTGITDLNKIIHLQLIIDTNKQSIFDIMDLLPNLQYLELDNSTILSIRDLGIGLRYITSLSLSTCGISDLDGIGVLIGLQELNLSNNYISDLTPLAMHENLKNLNLSSNTVSDLSFADALSSCPKLRSLFLVRNPVSKARNYRSVVASLISSLEMLDGSPVDQNAAKKVTNGMILEAAAELRVVEEDLDDEMRLENEILFGVSDSNSNAVNSPVKSRHETVWSPGRRPNTSETPLSPSVDLIPDTGSDLTHGSSVVLAGSMAAAIRRRRQALHNNSAASDSNHSVEGESALDILDAALNVTKKVTETAPISTSIDESVVKEGDVTEALMGNTVLFENKYPQRAQSARGNRSGNNNIHDNQMRPPLSSGKNSKINEVNWDDADAFADGSLQLDSNSNSSKAGLIEKSTIPMLEDFPVRSGSPRQRNSSRPQSAASFTSSSQSNSPSTSRRSSLISGAIAAPFKVTVEKDSSLNGSVTERSSLDDEDLIFSGIGARGRSATTNTGIAVTNKDAKKKLSSLVHLDIVKRGDFTDESDEDGDDEDEEMALSHAERLRLMARSTMSRRPGSATASMKNRRQVLLQLQSSSNAIDNDTAVYDNPDVESTILGEGEQIVSPSGKLSSSNTPNNNITRANRSYKSTPPSGIASRGSRNIYEEDDDDCDDMDHRPMDPIGAVTPSKIPKIPKNNTLHSSSSKAGISLGFNLAGSLAAIDKWVHDMSSDDDGNDDSDDNNSNSGDNNNGIISNFDNMNSCSTLFATADGNNDILLNQNIDCISKDSTSEPSNKTVKSKILSRDAIYDMCSGSARKVIRSQGSNTSFTIESDEESDADYNDDALMVANLSKGGTDKYCGTTINNTNRDNYGRKINNLQVKTGINNNVPAKVSKVKKSNAAAGSMDELGFEYSDDDSDGLLGGYVDMNDTTNYNDNHDIPQRVIKPHQEPLSPIVHRNSKYILAAGGAVGSSGRSLTRSRSSSKKSNPSSTNNTPKASTVKNNHTFTDDSNRNNEGINNTDNATQSDSRRSKSKAAAVPDFVVDSALPVSTDDSSPQRLDNDNIEKESNNSNNHKRNNIKANIGKANNMTDEELVELLRKPPKTTEILRTKSSFQEFFRGITKKRIRSLLVEAYSEITDRSERNAKIDKRMALLQDVIV